MTTYDLGVNIISTEMDLELFTNLTYQNMVYQALQNVRKNHKITNRHAIACYKEYIVVYDQNKHIVTMVEI